MNFDQKALSIEILGFKKRGNRTYRRNMSTLKQSRSLLRQMLWNMMNFRDIKQILTSLGEISE